MVACHQAGDRGPGSTSALACYCFLPSLPSFLLLSLPPSFPLPLPPCFPSTLYRNKGGNGAGFHSFFLLSLLTPYCPCFLSSLIILKEMFELALQMSLPVILCRMTPVEIGVQLHVGCLMRNHLCSSKNVYILVNWDTPQVARFSFMYDVNKTHGTFYFLIASFKYLWVLYQSLLA